MSGFLQWFNRLVRFPGFLAEIVHSSAVPMSVTGAVTIFRQHGLRAVLRRLINLVDDRHRYFFPNYGEWIRDIETPQLRPERTPPAPLPKLFSVLMPTYNTDPVFLRKALDSVLRQTFPRWELCVADDNSSDPCVRQLLAAYARKDSRIRLCLRQENGHISKASNSALALAEGDFIVLLDHDDELADDALMAVAREISAHPDAVIIFSDEDKITPDGKRFSPVFKPNWDPDLMLQRNFVSHLGVFRSDAVRSVGGFRSGYEGSQDWDLALRVSELCDSASIRHIPRVLYHWRAIRGSTALHLNEKSYAVVAGRRAVEDHIARRRMPLQCKVESEQAFWRIEPTADLAPKVTLMVGPFGDAWAASVAEHCTRLKMATDYPDWELLASSGDPSMSAAEVFASSVAQAHGKVLCFLVPGLVPLDRDWLRHLAVHAMRSDIGAVGARLLDASGRYTHAGLLMSSTGEMLTPYRYAFASHRGYLDGASLVQSVAAVGGGCIAVSKTHFSAAGGFTPGLSIGFPAEVDLSLCLAERGLRNLWVPHATLAEVGAPLPASSSCPPRCAGDNCRARGTGVANDNLELINNYPGLRFTPLRRNPNA